MDAQVGWARRLVSVRVPLSLVAILTAIGFGVSFFFLRKPGVLLLCTSLAFASALTLLLYYIPGVISRSIGTSVSTGIEALKQTEMPSGMIHKFKYTREEVYRVTALLNKETGELLMKLAKALNIPEDEALARMLMVGRIVLDKGLYGNPSASGMYLCVLNQATGEATKIMIPTGPVPADQKPDPQIKLVN